MQNFLQIKHLIIIFPFSQNDAIFGKKSIWFDIAQLRKTDFDWVGAILKIIIPVFFLSDNSEHPLLLSGPKNWMDIVYDFILIIFFCLS